jgi:hypothetical protein
MMSNAMTAERRRRERISAQKGAIAFSGSQLGQIVDANLDGLCFQYYTSTSKTTGRSALEEMGKGTLDIVFGIFDFFLASLPVDTVADFQVSVLDTGKSRQIVRRRVLSFGKLTPEQLFSLKRFLLLNRYSAIQRSTKTIRI